MRTLKPGFIYDRIGNYPIIVDTGGTNLDPIKRWWPLNDDLCRECYVDEPATHSRCGNFGDLGGCNMREGCAVRQECGAASARLAEEIGKSRVDAPPLAEKPAKAPDLAQGVPYDLVRKLVNAAETVLMFYGVHGGDSLQHLRIRCQEVEAAMKGAKPAAPEASVASRALVRRIEHFLDALDGGKPICTAMSSQQRAALRREVQAVRAQIGEDEP